MPAVTEPPGELIYRCMSLSGSSASRNSSWAMTRLANSSSMYVRISTSGSRSKSRAMSTALRDLEALLTERTQESERLRAEIGHLGEIAAENTFLQGLDILTGFLREAHVPTPKIERAWRRSPSGGPFDPASGAHPSPARGARAQYLK